ncbi:MAG: pyridoxamine 5'-phosphate oxidase family protein [Janthinobacterium lividum]
MSAPTSAQPSSALHWHQVESEEPDLATMVLARFTSARHHVLATLRRDGSPRVSGTEVEVWDGDLVLGSASDARKVLDLRHDPRFALHAHPGDGSMAGGDAKVVGLAEEILEPAALARYIAQRHPPEPLELFRLLLTTVVLTDLHDDVNGGHLRIMTLHPGRGVDVVCRT